MQLVSRPTTKPRPLDTIRNSVHPGIPGMEAFASVARAWEADEVELGAFLQHGLGDEHAVDDLLQDTFIKAMREGQGFCSLDNPYARLFRLARNVKTDRFRGVKALEPIEQHADAWPLAETAPALPVDALNSCLARVLSDRLHEDAEALHTCDISRLLRGTPAGASCGPASPISGVSC